MYSVSGTVLHLHNDLYAGFSWKICRDRCTMRSQKQKTFGKNQLVPHPYKDDILTAFCRVIIQDIFRKNLAIERMIVEGCDILLDVNQVFVRQGTLIQVMEILFFMDFGIVLNS